MVAYVGMHKALRYQAVGGMVAAASGDLARPLAKRKDLHRRR
jgi:hypothetical protein